MANNRQKGREGGKHDGARGGWGGVGGQRLAGSSADSSQELFEKMRWEKGKRQSDTGIRESGENIGKKKRLCQQSVIDFCVYVLVYVAFCIMPAPQPSESACVHKIQICIPRPSVYSNIMYA